MKKKQKQIHSQENLINQFLFPSIIERLHLNILNLNNSKFFAGIVMIMLNIGTKFIPIQISESAEKYVKYSISKKLLVFTMAWMGTRDIYIALSLTIIFILMSDYFFNEESVFCLVPHESRWKNTEDKVENMQSNTTDTNNKITQEEMNEFTKLVDKIKNIINTKSK